MATYVTTGPNGNVIIETDHGERSELFRNLDGGISAAEMRTGYTEILTDAVIWEIGTITNDTGTDTYNPEIPDQVRTRGFIPAGVDRIIAGQGIGFALYVYSDDGEYLGMWNGEYYEKTLKFIGDADLAYLKQLYPDYQYRLKVQAGLAAAHTIIFLGAREYSDDYLPDNIQLEHFLPHMVAIGDSLTAGAYYANGADGSPIPENYPYYLMKMTNVSITNVSECGSYPSKLWNDYLKNYDFTNFDGALVWLGTNLGITDTYDSDVAPYDDPNEYANTQMGYYCRILDRMILHNPNIRIFIANIYAGGHSVSTGTTFEGTNNAIESIVKAYPDNVVAMLDTRKLKYHGNGDFMHPSNVLHFGKVGNLFLADFWLKGIRRAIFSRPSMFEIASGQTLPDGYQRCDYLESVEGRASLDTGIAGNDTTLEFAGDCRATTFGAYSGFLTNYTGSDKRAWRVLQPAEATGTQIIFSNYFSNTLFLRAVTGTWENLPVRFVFLLKYKYAEATVSGLTVNGTSATDSGLAENDSNIFIGRASSSAGGTAIHQYYWFKIWKQGALVRHYIPCIRTSDLKAGFYDLVNGTFNPSTGSQEFTAHNN